MVSLPTPARALVPVLALLFASTALAGCIFDPQPATAKCTINRIWALELDPASAANADAASLENLIEASFRLTFNVAGAASEFQIRYLDRNENEVTEPLSEFVGAVQQGTVVTIPEVHVVSPATVLQNGDPLCTRGTVARDWWTVLDAPLGVTFEPGSALAYSMGSTGGIDATAADERLGPDGAFHVSSAALDLNVQQTGEVRLDLSQEAQTVDTSDGEKQAHKLAWSLSSETRFPISAEIDATVSADGESQAFNMGLQVKDAKATFTGAGSAFTSPAKEVLVAGLERGAVRVDASVAMWSTAFSPYPECEGSTRDDPCEPFAFASLFPIQRDLDPAETDFTAFPVPERDEDVLRSVEAFFGEAVVPGDRFTATFKLEGDALNRLTGASRAGSQVPDDLLVDATFDLTVVGAKDVTVAAGTFPTIELLQELTILVDTRGGSFGNYEIGAINVRETVSRVTTNLHAETFVPVTVTTSMPFDLKRMLESWYGALDQQARNALGLGDKLPFDLTLVAEGSLELTNHKGTSAMSPWLAVMLAQMLPSAMSLSYGMLAQNPFSSQQALPVQASVAATAVDSDANNLRDTIQLVLSNAANAPFSAREVVVTANGFVVTLYEDQAKTNAFDDGESWANGESLYLACFEGTANVVVQIGGTIVLQRSIACDEGSGGAPTIDFSATAYDGDEAPGNDGIRLTLLQSSEGALFGFAFDVVVDGASAPVYADAGRTTLADGFDDMWEIGGDVYVDCPAAATLSVLVVVHGDEFGPQTADCGADGRPTGEFTLAPYDSDENALDDGIAVTYDAGRLATLGDSWTIRIDDADGFGYSVSPYEDAARTTIRYGTLAKGETVYIACQAVGSATVSVLLDFDTTLFTGTATCGEDGTGSES